MTASEPSIYRYSPSQRIAGGRRLGRRRGRRSKPSWPTPPPRRLILAIAAIVLAAIAITDFVFSPRLTATGDRRRDLRAVRAGSAAVDRDRRDPGGRARPPRSGQPGAGDRHRRPAVRAEPAQPGPRSTRGVRPAAASCRPTSNYGWSDDRPPDDQRDQDGRHGAETRQLHRDRQPAPGLPRHADDGEGHHRADDEAAQVPELGHIGDAERQHEVQHDRADQPPRIELQLAHEHNARREQAEDRARCTDHSGVARVEHVDRDAAAERAEHIQAR